jgi:hypothetical protein
MSYKFDGQSVQEGKKSFHTITTDHTSFSEAGMSMFSTDHIYEKFLKGTEKNSVVRIINPVNVLTPARVAATRAARFLMTPSNTCPDPADPLIGTCAKAMIWDAALKQYIERVWTTDAGLSPVWAPILNSTLASGQNDLELLQQLKLGLGAGASRSDYTPIEALSYIATLYNHGKYNLLSTDTPAESLWKTARSNLVKEIQTSLSGCLSWSLPFDFVFGDANATTPTSQGAAGGVGCTVTDTATFEYRVYDSLSAKRDKRKLVMAGSPSFTFIPSHPWGTQFAGNRPNDGIIGSYASLEMGGEDNPQNLVSTELDTYLNTATGKAEAGTRQVLAKMVTELSRVMIKPVPEGDALDTSSDDDWYDDAVWASNYFASGYAVPLSVHGGNPHMFGPTFEGRSCSEPSNKKQRLLVINRSQRSFPIGRVVLLQRMDNEWIPIDFGDDKADGTELSVGKWGFQYLVADGDSYFKDDRYYYEEQYQPELTGSTSPTQYEAMFRTDFYSSIHQMMAHLNAHYLDNANRGTMQIHNTASGPAGGGCQPTGVPPATTQTVATIEALNGAWTKVTTSTTAQGPGCYTPSSNCLLADEIDALLAGTHAGYPTNSIKDWLFDKDGEQAVSDPQYDGDFSLDARPTYSNFSSPQYPAKVYTKTARIPHMMDPPDDQIQEYEKHYPHGTIVTSPNPPHNQVMSAKVNHHNCTWMCSEEQRQSNWDFFFGLYNLKQRCVGAMHSPAASVSFITALRDKFRARCVAEEANAPKITSHTWIRAAADKKFVGSRRYLNVTSFDMLSSHWNGHNAVDWLGRTNPTVDIYGGVVEDPSDQKFNQFHPFWGAVFTDGYTKESVTQFMAKRASNAYIASAVSNNNTAAGQGSTGGLICSSYLIDGFQSPNNTNVNSYARSVNGLPLSLDTIHFLGDVHFCHLPADIGTNASPSGKNGTPITDFHRMVNLTNVHNHGSYDPLRKLEEPTPWEGQTTLDWGDGKNVMPPNPYSFSTTDMAYGVKTYFANKYYNIGGGGGGAGVKMTIPDRYSWVSTQPNAPNNETDANGNTLGKVTSRSMDSWYDLEPLSKGNVTFMPLTAEWIGSFDSYDQVYGQAQTRSWESDNGNKEHFPAIWFDQLTVPLTMTQGAGMYWFDTAGKPTQDQNVTIQRLSHYPLDAVYDLASNLNHGSYITAGGGATKQVFPDAGAGIGANGAKYAALTAGHGGSRGNPIFTIGRNNNYVYVDLDTMATMGGTGPQGHTGGSTGGGAVGDYEFMETEDAGDKITDKHGLFNPTIGVVANQPHTVKLEPGFPYDGYVRHRSADGVVGPLAMWHPANDAADCVGIITAKALVKTAANSLIIDTQDTRGIQAAQPTIEGDPVGQWGGVGSTIQSLGGAHLFARVFEAWPDDQTLFDARYFAVMHFNDGDLISPPNTEQVESASMPGGKKTYIRHALATDVDFRIPTLVDNAATVTTTAAGVTRHDVTNWPECPLGKQIYKDTADMAPEDLWRVTTIRRGMLLPFTYKVPTIGVSEMGIFVIASHAGNPQLGTGFQVGDTMTFTGGLGEGARIRILNVDPATGAIIHDPADLGTPQAGFVLIDEGKDYQKSDFMDQSWYARNRLQGIGAIGPYKEPTLQAVPDAGSTGKNAMIFATKGQIITKEVTDQGPQTSQNAPVRMTYPVPTTRDDGIGREEDRAGAQSLSLFGADGISYKNYDAFFHYHNDITSVMQFDGYRKAAKNVLRGNNKVQFLRMSMSSRL